MATVTAGCKLPNGIIMEMGDKRQVLNGTNASSIIGGHGITEYVDKEFFEAWVVAKKDMAFIKGGFIFAHDKAANTAAEAKDKVDSETGLEGMDPADKPSGLTEVS